MPAKYSLREDGILDPEGKYLNPFTKRPYSAEYKKEAITLKDGVNKGWSGYRTWEDRFEILKKIHNYQVVLIIAPTGVGKTVIVPKLFLHYFGYKIPVICTTPRQKTTRKAGEYAAQLMDVHLTIKDKKGKEIWARDKDFYVGYKYGDMQVPKSDKDTKLLFSTDGTIKVMITKSNPNLDGYAGIIIDEAHERSVSIDILYTIVIILHRYNFFINENFLKTLTNLVLNRSCKIDF
jgi:HrpA-like RNA helicase